jgi:hypothetical protein
MLGICFNTVKQKFEMFSPLSFGNDLRGKDWIISDPVGPKPVKAADKLALWESGENESDARLTVICAGPTTSEPAVPKPAGSAVVYFELATF